MNKTFLFLVSVLLLLVGCSSEDKYADNDASSQSGPIRWYGMQLPEEPQTRGVANGSKLWEQKANITIKFLNLPSDRTLTDSLKMVAQEWEKYANVHFDFVRGDKDADIRIAFNWMSNDWLTWSYTGTDAKTVTNQRVPTAVFGGLNYMTPKQQRGDMLRLLGQVLGLEYEQRHQQWAENGYWKDESQLQAYWEAQFKGYYKMKWDEVKDYVFTPMTKNNTSTLYASKDIDKQSIMAWPYYSSSQANLLIANYELSAGDKSFIAQLYPKDGQNLPTTQEFSVDMREPNFPKFTVKDLTLIPENVEWILPNNVTTKNALITTHYFPKKGEYPVTLKYTYDDGTSSTYTQNVIIPQNSVYFDKNESLVWSDEFEKSSLNMAYWNQYTGVVYNNEKQEYVTDKKYTYIQDGKLILKANIEGGKYKSAKVTTLNKIQVSGEGRIEVRAKLPGGRGLWPAIWLCTDTYIEGRYAEIDIIEHVGINPNKVSSAVHTQRTIEGVDPSIVKEVTLNTVESEFNTYGVIIEQGKIQFYINSPDNIILTHTEPNIGDPRAWPFTTNRPMNLVMNVAVGGNWAGSQGIDNNAFPCQMEVEYARFFKKNK